MQNLIHSIRLRLSDSPKVALVMIRRIRQGKCSDKGLGVF